MRDLVLLYRLGPNHEVIACDDLLEWGEHYEDDRVVAQTGHREVEMVDSPYGRYPEQVGGIEVSTVFLGLDHRFWGDGPPLVFETMVFGGPYDRQMERYGSWAAAEAGHKRWVTKVFPALTKTSQPASSHDPSLTEKNGSDGGKAT